MSLQYVDAQGNHYVRGWGQPDFTDAEKKKLGIGQYRDERGFEHGDRGKNYQNPGSLDKRIEDLFSRLPTSTGWPEGGTTIKDPRTPYPEAPGRTNPEDYVMDGPAPGRGYADVQPDPTFTGSDWLNQQLPSQAPRPEGLQRVATGIADWITGNKWDLDQRGGSGIPRGRGQYYPRVLATTMMGRHSDGTPVTFDNPYGKVDGTEVTNTDGIPLTPPMQTPPAEVPTPPLEVERYPSGIRKDDYRYNPETGRFNMVHIPKFDDPNYQEGVRPRGIPESAWDWMQRQKSGGEGVQYRR